jgi:hypothetical protein
VLNPQLQQRLVTQMHQAKDRCQALYPRQPQSEQVMALHQLDVQAQRPVPLLSMETLLLFPQVPLLERPLMLPQALPLEPVQWLPL